MPKKRVLIVEDDKKLAYLIRDYLERFEFNVAIELSGLKAAAIIKTKKPDLVILDLMLPGFDGLSICREVRQVYKGFILMLTAIEENMDQVAAIELGVDDYVVKPIELRVLLARARMLLRRSDHETDFSSTPNEITKIVFDDLSINRCKREVLLGDHVVNLSDGEFEVLWILASNPEKVTSRNELFKNLRGIEYNGFDRAIDFHMVGLRKKLGDSNRRPNGILTVRGKGYLFVSDAWKLK